MENFTGYNDHVDNITTTAYEETTGIPQESLSRSQHIFYIAVRGVLYYTVQLVATFLNISTVIAISKYKNLQVTSNVLVACLSIGHSLAGISGTLLLATDFFLDNNSSTWKIVCTVLIFFLLSQQTINYMSIMAISIERTYTIYFPMQALKNNNFKRMQKIAVFILGYCFALVSAQLMSGFLTENFKYTAVCIFLTITGKTVLTYGVILVFAVFSVISLFMTGLIIVKLIKLRRIQSSNQINKHTQREYKITKMLTTVLGLYYLLYLPVIVNFFITYSWRFYGLHIFTVLLACNGIASPLVYVWQNDTFRRQICIMYGLRVPDGPRSNISTLSTRSTRLPSQNQNEN